MQTLMTLSGQATARQAPPPEIVVVFTTIAETVSALRAASTLARGSEASIRLLVPQVVPYPLPVNEPAVRPSHVAGGLLALAEEAGVEARIEIRLCRARGDALRQSLQPGSIVVLGSRCRWWQSGPGQLGRMLRNEGHHVVLCSLK